MQPITWADSYGVWHVKVSKNAAAPIIAARRALRDELLARDSHCDRSVWMKPVLVEQDDETLTYREGEVDDSVLDCGHRPTVEIDSLGTGASRDKDGKTACYPCTDANILAQVKNHDAPIALYVKGNTLISWSGGPIMFIDQNWKGGRRYSNHGWWHMRYVTAHDEFGGKWRGQCSDEYDAIVMRPKGN